MSSGRHEIGGGPVEPVGRPSWRGRLVNTKTIFVLGALAAVLFGYDNGIIGGAILFIPHTLALTPTLKGLVVSSAVVGAMVGAVGTGPASDRWGRHRLLLVAGIVYAVGAFGAGLAPSVTTLIASRFVLGLGIGISSVAVPLYLAEMAPTHLRGTATSLNQYMIVIGTALAGGVGYGLSFSGSWRWMLGIGVFPALVLIGGIAFMPDTPRSLVHRGHLERARQTLATLRPHDAAGVDAELSDITDIDRDDTGATGQGDHDPGARHPAGLFRAGWVRRLLLLGALLAFFQQITGINTIVYYSPTVLHSFGLSQSDSLLFSFLNGVLNIVTIAVIVQAKVVDRWGRKLMLLTGLVGMSASLLAIGIGSLIVPAGSTAELWLTIVAFVVFTNTFSATWGPVLWVVLAEIFPLRIRGVAMGIATLVNWLTDFFVSQTFPTFSHLIGSGIVLLAYGAGGILVFIAVWLILPETKDHSLEDLERRFRRGTVMARRRA